MEVHPIAFEGIAWLNLDGDEQVARIAARKTRLTFFFDAQSRAVLDTRGDGEFQLAFFLFEASAIAEHARVSDQDTLALTVITA